jgi:hypothetical protein
MSGTGSGHKELTFCKSQIHGQHVRSVSVSTVIIVYQGHQGLISKFIGTGEQKYWFGGPGALPQKIC